jgi:RHS repeat-associated protein
MYSDGAYGPFGEAYAQTGTTDLSYTGMNQDTVSNLYDFPAREYGTQGRWPSPDPSGSSSASPTDPQTWNRYAYVTNSPLRYVDATGMVRTPPGLVPGDGSGWSADFGACVWDDGSNDDPDDPNTGTAEGCAAQGGTFDSQLGDSDYNPEPDQDLADFVAEIQDSQVVVVNGQDGSNSTPSWAGCVAKTALTDAAWGAAGSVAVGVVGSTVIMGVAGSELGPGGTAAGAGLGFSIGVSAAPIVAVEGAINGGLLGIFHGVVACSFSGGGGD